MNKSYIIGAVVVLAVALLAWVGLSGRSVDQTDDNDNNTASTSLRELITGGKAVQCQFSSTEAGSESTGEVFVASAAKMRADFTAKIEGKDQVGHMIMKDQKVFVWLDGEAQGVTMAVPEDGTQTGDNKTPLNFDDKNVSYDCDSWRVDDSKFVEPTTVKFMDLAGLVGAGASASVSAGATANPPQCAACDQLAGAQKAQCRTALKCQ